MKRRIIFFKTYFVEFYISLSDNDQEKIEYVLDIIRNLQQIPRKFFKHIEGTDGLYEIRISTFANEYRIFCCFDSGMIVVLFSAFKKKSQKTPKNEIDKALNLMDNYYNEKLK